MGQEDAFQLVYLCHPGMKKHLVILSRLFAVSKDMGAEPVVYLTLHTDEQAQGYSPPAVPVGSPDFDTQDLHWFEHLSILADAPFLLVKNAHSWHISAMPAVFFVFPE